MSYPLVLDVNKKKGFLSFIPCVLIFTGQAILFAHIDKELQNRIFKEKKEKMKEEGIGFIGQSAGMMKATGEYISLFHEKTEDEILKESNLNFKIENNQVSQIVFKPVNTVYNQDSGTTQTGGKMVIRAGDEIIKAIHRFQDSNKGIRKYLKEVYGKAAR